MHKLSYAQIQMYFTSLQELLGKKVAHKKTYIGGKTVMVKQPQSSARAVV